MLVVPLPDDPPRPRIPDDAPTLVACPWCDGHGCVAVAKRAEWMTVYPELTRT